MQHILSDWFRHMTSVEQVLFWVSLFLVVVTLFHVLSPQPREAFSSSDQFVFKQGPEQVFDQFYANIYDVLVFDRVRGDYEVGEIINLTKPNEHSVILDVGCATGNRTKQLSSAGLRNILGVDQAPTMIQKAKQKFPDLQFKVMDVTADALAFQPSSFTHILCMYYTIYYMRNKGTFFRHCMEWLMPGGYLVVHMVDRDKVDPMLPPTVPRFAVKTDQKRKKKLQLENMEYQSTFDLSGDRGVLTEKFKMKQNGMVRQQQQELYMEDTAQIVNQAQDAGFVVLAKVDMATCAYEHQHLYVFVKPN